MPVEVEPPVPAEVGVLRRRRRQRQVGRHRLQRHPVALDPAEPQPLGEHQHPRRRVHPAEQQHQPHRRQRQPERRPQQPAPEPPHQPPRPPNDHRRFLPGKPAPRKRRAKLRSAAGRMVPTGAEDDMAERGFTLTTHWLVAATIEEVAAILSEPERLPEWWPAVYLSVEIARSRRRRRPRPHRRLPHPRLAPLHAALAGPRGRGPPPARLDHRGDRRPRRPRRLAAGAARRPRRRRLRLADRRREAAPEAAHAGPQPVYAANHRWAMARGLEGLQRELVRRRAALTRPPSPAPRRA